MKYNFRKYRGAQLINVIFKFLKEHGIQKLPILSVGKGILLYSDSEGTAITCICVEYRYYYFQIRQTEDGISHLFDSLVFFYL